jgi:HSP20 family protein
MFTMNDLSKSLNRTWDNVSHGWQQLMNRAGNALTRFTGRQDESDHIPVHSPRWGLMSAEVFDDAEKVVVRLEVPGLNADDFDVSVVENVLIISGEKRFEREQSKGEYHVLERAYGQFTRSIPLGYEVDADSAQATYKNGVLRMELHKKPEQQRRQIQVN